MTSPPPTPVETTIARKLSTPRAAPIQPSASARAFASLSTATGIAIVVGQGRREREASPCGDVERRHRAGVHRVRRTPRRTRGARPPRRRGPRARAVTSTSKSAAASVVAGVGTTRATRHLAEGVHDGRGELGAADVDGEVGAGVLRRGVSRRRGGTGS